MTHLKPASAMPLLILGFIAFAATGVIFGFLGRLHPAFDSFAHFRLHFAALLIGGGAISLMAGLRREALMAAVLALGAFASVQPLPGPAAATANGGPRYKLLQFNGRFDNAEPRRFLSLIGRERPDVIALQEMSASWQKALEPIAAVYPHRHRCAHRGPLGGVMILSRRPFWPGSAPQCRDEGALATANLDFGGRRLTIAALHLEWPWPHSAPAQIKRLEADIGALGSDAMLAGDFNAAPWSAAVTGIAAENGMSIVPGLGPTWLHHSLNAGLARWIGLPLDNVLHGAGVSVVSARTLEPAGSDHLPVLVEFSLLDETELPQTVWLHQPSAMSSASARRPAAAAPSFVARM